MCKGKYGSKDNTKKWENKKGKLLPKMERSPDERHTQTQANLIEIFR